MNKTVYEYVIFNGVVDLRDSVTARGLAKSAIFAEGRGQGKIAWNPKCDFTYKPTHSGRVFVSGRVYYRGCFKLTLPLRQFEIREGNGNDGEYHRGYIEAWDAFEALRIASRDGMIVRPWDVKLSDMQGDDTHAYLVSYVSPIYGDSCRWCASASQVVSE